MRHSRRNRTGGALLIGALCWAAQAQQPPAASPPALPGAPAVAPAGAPVAQPAAPGTPSVAGTPPATASPTPASAPEPVAEAIFDRMAVEIALLKAAEADPSV